MAETFTWNTERGVTPNIEYKTTEIQFGDGYRQVVAEGINNKEESYPVTFHAYENDSKLIKAFFDRHKGVKSFFWTPPLEPIGLYSCNDAKPVAQGGGLYVWTATFVKVYASTSL